MTSRTPIGVHPRPPQRTLSTSSTLSVQRPPHQQRALSQQFFPSSPARKDSGDLSGEAVDPVQGRHATTPRRGGSRLRLELSNTDLTGSSVSATSSPQGLTPSRSMPMTDPMDADNASPVPSKASQSDADNPPLPMPKRRPPILHTFATSNRPAALAPAPLQLKKDGRPKAWTVEVPADAPRYPPNDKRDFTHRDPFSRGLFSGYADFFPWNGHHYEDDWSAEASQKGTWDKGNQTETTSARLAISPAIKQKNNLTALSTIFMGVLNHRRHRGQVTAPSTFKPPPRVTLTDTKREVWLKDLANPAISLRRLSRTIPHGIRGRTLLDQCLNKNVPTERAVWLAKCVGANEIRAFKRKGANSGAFALGGEFKWIRDWTVFVEQFVDAVVSGFGESDWKAKVTYAIRLATNLYSEQLLDRDHYLDWIMSGLEHSPQSRIPMWILIAQICWADLLRSRKYGRRLVYALLNHLDTIHNDPDKDILIQLSSQLSTLLDSLVKNNPDSFISPGIWPKYREALNASLSTDDKIAKAAYQRINFRNGRLSVASTASPPAGRQRLVQLLDLTLQNPVDRHLSTKCWATSDDKIQIVKTTVEWATSFHRPGLAKVYIAANLIRAWSALRINSTSVILEHIDSILAGEDIRKQMAYHLITELVRTGHFSIPQYIKWLIARGNCRDASEVDSEAAPCATRLLVNLPLHSLTEEQKRDRGNLLRRAANYSVAEEADDIQNALKYVTYALGFSVPGDTMANRKSIPLRKLLRKIADSTKAVRSCIGAHLRDTLTQQPLNKSVFVMSPAMFAAMRSVLETTQDYSMLSEVLNACVRATNVDVLASCIDTINLNLQVFFALGTADDLFGLFLARLKSVNQERGLVARPLLAALCCLARRMPHRGEISKYLAHELARSDRNNASDACSPVSDNMVNPAQTADGEVSEQIDKMLASGNSVDHPTMNRLFRYIIPRLETGWGKMDDSRRVYASLLTRLRLFDSQHFDKLMTDWVSHVRLLKDRPQLAGIFPLLVITDCLSISTILHTANSMPPASVPATSDPSSPGSATYLQDLLQLVLVTLPAGTDFSSEEAYRFNIHQQSARSDHHKGLLLLIRNAVIEYAGLRGQPGQSSMPRLPLEDAACRESILDALRLLVVTHLSEVTEAFNAKNIPPEGVRLIHGIASSLLVSEEGSDLPGSFDRILALANELTMPFCQIKINMDLSLARSRSVEGEEQGPSRFDLFAKAMDRAIAAQNIMWTTMLPCLSEDISQQLKNQTRTRFLDLVPSPKSPNLQDTATSQDSIRLAENLLGVVEAIISGQPPPKSAHLTGGLVEKLSDLVSLVAVKDQDKAKAQAAVIDKWLPILLRFITLHSITSEPVAPSAMTASIQGKITIPASHEARARIILVLCRLLLELDALPHHLSGDLSQQVFDTATLLVDGLPDDLRVHAARSILLLPGSMPSMNLSSDSRLYYILSIPQPTAMDNFMVAHKEKLTLPHTATVRNMNAMLGIGAPPQEKLSPFVLRRWEMLSEPTPNVGENDTSLSLGLFEAIKIQ